MGRIFSIEEFSTFDGPGIRTTVFLKGCPLSCTWCHNPEGQRAAPDYLRSPLGCLACGACERAGDGGRLGEASISACPRGLIRRSGEEITASALTARLIKNARILESSGGGVTFSGGEPLMQSDFLIECLSMLKGKLHRALQTSGYARPAVFSEVLSHADYLLYDLKLMDDRLHREYCGAGNAEIHENYVRLVRSGLPFVTRIPLIPGVTDTRENLSAVADFLLQNGVRYAELLPYNRYAGSKYAALRREYTPRFDEDAPVSHGQDIFAARGIEAKIL